MGHGSPQRNVGRNDDPEWTVGRVSIRSETAAACEFDDLQAVELLGGAPKGSSLDVELARVEVGSVAEHRVEDAAESVSDRHHCHLVAALGAELSEGWVEWMMSIDGTKALVT